jgi:MFS transporter, DHA1 family, inner membrane transport protein
VGWRFAFGIVAALALTCTVLVFLFVPSDGVNPNASPLRELEGLRRSQIWLTLAIGAVGFGGMFAVYTYLGSTLIDVTKVKASAAPLIFSIFGMGLTAGNLLIPRYADRALMPTAGYLLLWSAAVLALYPMAASHYATVALDVFAIGLGGALATVLQTRLMDVAGDSQALAAALNHSAFNIANALGPWLGGLTIAAGFGLVSPRRLTRATIS